MPSTFARTGPGLYTQAQAARAAQAQAARAAQAQAARAARAAQAARAQAAPYTNIHQLSHHPTTIKTGLSAPKGAQTQGRQGQLLGAVTQVWQT